MGPVNGINKDVSGTKLQPTTVSACPVDCDCMLYSATYWTHSTAVCVLMVTLIRLRHPTHPHYPPTTPDTPTHHLLCAICDITVTVKQVDTQIYSNI